jgi:hypothetical protein
MKGGCLVDEVWCAGLVCSYVVLFEGEFEGEFTGGTRCV